MAFEYAGNLNGNKGAIVQNFQIGADMYVGQIVAEDYSNFYGHIIPIAAAGAAPDVTHAILGLCNAVVTSPTYDQTYQGDKATYDSTQATLVANDPVGPTMVAVTIWRPGDMWRAPIVKDTIGTVMDEYTETLGDATGKLLTHATATNFQAGYATAYCRTGANRGQYRVITSGSTTTKVPTVPFTYDIAQGDTFVVAAMKLGRAMMALDSQFQGIDGDLTTGGSYYNVFCHQLDLESSGREFAIVSLEFHHTWYVHSTSYH